MTRPMAGYQGVNFGPARRIFGKYYLHQVLENRQKLEKYVMIKLAASMCATRDCESRDKFKICFPYLLHFSRIKSD